MQTIRKFFDWFMRDDKGRVVLVQAPNMPLCVAIAAWLTSLVASGVVHTAADLVSFGAIFTWTWLEISSGTTRVRRVLGAVVMIWIIWSRLHSSLV